MDSVGVLPRELYDIKEEDVSVDAHDQFGKGKTVKRKKTYTVLVDKVRGLTVDEFLKP